MAGEFLRGKDIGATGREESTKSFPQVVKGAMRKPGLLSQSWNQVGKAIWGYGLIWLLTVLD
jgi:hypothetical protein